MTFGNPFATTLLYTHTAATNRTGAVTTKTNLATVSIPAYELQLGACLFWQCGGSTNYATADRNLQTSIELGSFATYDTNHQRSGTNQGAVHGSNCFALVTGGLAGNFTVTGITTGDTLVSVVYFPAAGGGAAGLPVNLTSQFTITAANTINNAGGTNTSGGMLDVRWGRQFLPDGTVLSGPFYGCGFVTVQSAPSAAATVVGSGTIRYAGGVDQGGGVNAASNGFDTDMNLAGTVNTTTALSFGFFAAWGAGSNAADNITLNMFSVSLLGYRSPL